jgi:tetratricopeptide (TPR) repeat protein
VARSRLTQEASTQFRYGLARRAANDLEGAAYYLAAARRLDPAYAPAAKELASLHLAQSRWTNAQSELQAYLQLEPRDAVAHQEMARLQARLDQPEKARRHFEKALQLNPDDSLAHFQFAAFLAPRDPATAISRYRTGLHLQPDNRFAANNLAWLLATHPREEIRNPAEALKIALRLDRESGGTVPNLLDTLAAAQAATGDFEAAAATTRKALSLPQTAQNQQLAEGLNTRLTHYVEGKPYLETESAQ